MAYRSLGASGLMVSAVGIGCNAFGRRVGPEGVRDVLSAARDTGVTLLDTADVYGDRPGVSEELLGEALKGQRDHFVVATKFGADLRGLYGEGFGARGTRRYVRRAVEGSLRRLRIDQIDLYQLHRPDPVTPLEETLSVLSDLVAEGKVGYLGCSNFPAWQLADAAWIAQAGGLQRFVSVQNQYSLLTRGVEEEVVPAARRFGLGVLPFFPLEAGLLTGKYRRGQPPPPGSRFAREAGRAEWLAHVDWDRLDRLRTYAAHRDVALIDVAIAGLAAQPAVASVIAGATRGEQVRANAAALRWSPTHADLEELHRITTASPRPVPSNRRR